MAPSYKRLSERIQMKSERSKHYKNDNEQLQLALKLERAKASQAVMDLFYALRTIKGQPTLKDLVKLAKRIK